MGAIVSRRWVTRDEDKLKGRLKGVSGQHSHRRKSR